jgi:hypothetical protein
MKPVKLKAVFIRVNSINHKQWQREQERLAQYGIKLCLIFKGGAQ